MATSLLQGGAVNGYARPEIARRLIPSLAARAKLVEGLDDNSFQFINPRDERFIGASDDQSVSNTIEFQTDFYGDACVDLEESFVSVSFRTEIQTYEADGDISPWSTSALRHLPVSVRNGAGALLFSRATTRINDVDVSDSASTEEDGMAHTSFIQVLTQEPPQTLRGGPSMVLSVPGPTGEGAGSTDAGQIAPGTYWPGVVPGSAIAPTTSGMPRCVVSQIGIEAFHPEGWCLADSHSGIGFEGTTDLTYGENTVYPVAPSRSAGWTALNDSPADNEGFTTIEFRPPCGIWRQKLALPPGCRLNLQLQKSAAQRFIQSQFRSAASDPATTFNMIAGTRVTWLKATLWLKVIRPLQPEVNEINLALASAKRFIIPMVTRRIFAAQPVTGTLSVDYAGLFAGVMPARLHIYLSRSHQQSGMTPQSLARWSPFAISEFGSHDPLTKPPLAQPYQWTQQGQLDRIPGISFLQVTTPDGRSYPREPYDVNLVVDDSKRRYRAYTAACSSTPALSYSAWCGLYPVVVVDVNVQTAGMESEDLAGALGRPVPYSNQGLTLRIAFDSAVPAAGDIPATDETPADFIPPLWVIVVAEQPAALELGGGPLGSVNGSVNVRRLGY